MMASDLLKIFKHFLYRDIFYLLGGLSVISSFLYYFDKLKIYEWPVFYFLVISGIAYVIGYTIKEFFSLTPLISNNKINKSAYKKIKKKKKNNQILLDPSDVPGKIVKKLYSLHEGRDWDSGESENLMVFTSIVRKDFPDEFKDEYERLLSFKHLGQIMGSCGIVSSLLILLKALKEMNVFTIPGLYYDLILALIIFFLSIILLCLAWSRFAQQIRYIADKGLIMKFKDKEDIIQHNK